MKRNGEALLRREILRIIANGSVWTNAQVKAEISKRIALTGDDKAASESRDGEPKWFIIVNNALADGRGLYGPGAVERVGRGRHRITETGRHLLAQWEMWDELFEEFFRDELRAEATKV